MKRKSRLSFLILATFLFLFLSFSRQSVEKIQGTTATFFYPIWSSFASLKLQLGSFAGRDRVFSDKIFPMTLKEEMEELRLQNELLKQKTLNLENLYQQELILKESLFALKVNDSEELDQSLRKHRQEQLYLCRWQLDAIPGRIIYRAPSSWNSSLWLNVGEKDNRALGRTVIAKNSPVVVGTSIVGVVDLVTDNLTRVRLITDSAITPSVRVKRISDQNVYYLAKGELHGSGNPIWRSQSNVLKGIGFNYDYADEDGPARDLRTGKSLDVAQKIPQMSILQVNDLLVSTGMDGIFPAGFQVAKVTKVAPLKEGDYYYELEAIPTVGNMDNLSLVFLLPPVAFGALPPAHENSR